MTALEILLSLVSKEVCGRDIADDISAELTDEKLRELYTISKTHDLTHLVGCALKKINAPAFEGLLAPFYDEHIHAVFRYRRYADELNQISELFESAGIEHIALKGAVLRGYYPEPWMRTSCDIDILVKKSEIERAQTLLVDRLGYTVVSKTGHDVSLNSQTGVHLELHFALIEDYVLRQSHDILNSVWERTVLAEGKKYTRLMTDEMFYFYHIVHMAKHFISGGCGIRTFLDLWILENRISFDSSKRAELISEAGLSAFEGGAKKLISVWFDGSEHNDITRSFERFVLRGGAYGTVENGVSIGVVRKRGRLRYVIARVFPSYRTMKNMYSVLERRKWLLPFYHVKRWCRIIFCGGAKKARAQLAKSKNVTAEEFDDVKNLLSELGLAKDMK